MNALFSLLFALSTPEVDTTPVIAKLGETRLTQLDIDAALLDIPDEVEADVISDPEQVGQILEGILLRRAVVEKAEGLLTAEEIEALSAQARRERMIRIGMNKLLDRAIDQTAIEIRAHELYEQAMSEWEPYDLYSFDMLAVSVELGWDESKALLEDLAEKWQSEGADPEKLVVTAVTEQQQGYVIFSQHTEANVANLEPAVQLALADLEPGDFSEPVATTHHYHALKLHGTKPATAPTFNSEAQQWRNLAKQELHEAERERIQTEKTPDEVLAWTEQNAEMTPAELRHIQHDQERAILSAYKARYLEQNMANRDVSILAREKYLTSPEDYRSARQADFYSVEVAGLGAEGFAAIERELAQRVELEGAAELESIVFDLLADMPIGRGVSRPATSMFEMEKWVQEIVVSRADEKKFVGRIPGQSVDGIYAIENYQPSKPLPFDAVREDIIDSLQRTASENVWQLHMSDFRNQPLVVTDPAALEPSG